MGHIINLISKIHSYVREESIHLWYQETNHTYPQFQSRAWKGSYPLSQNSLKIQFPPKTPPNTKTHIHTQTPSSQPNPHHNTTHTEMVSATPTPPGPNPNIKSPKNVYHIRGIQVEFPYQPYGSQLAFMGRVISTLDRAQRENHCHALLESPLSTGKSLSLLCSTLAWQQSCKLKNQFANLTHSKPNPEAFTDPLAHGG